MNIRKKIGLMLVVLLVLVWASVCVRQGARALNSIREQIDERYDYIELLEDDK